MTERARLGWSTRVAVLATAVLVPAALHLCFGRQHLNLADEGYLWYGVQRTLAGEVPLRDFQAYDPGRYHWCALWAPLVGDGIVGVRAAVAAYAALALAAGLAVLARAVRHPAALALGGVLLGLWLFPRHKLFEPATSLLVTWATVRMLEAPTPRRHLALGLVVGLAGYVGRNHGLYGVVASAAAIALDAWKEPRPGLARRLGAWAGGIALGCVPFVGLMLFTTGFARALVDSILLFVARGANLARAWPWPWSLDLAGLTPAEAWRELTGAVAFLLPVFALPALLWTVVRAPRAAWRARAALAGAVLVGSVYLHHASVRSDVFHLAQSLPPLLVALLALPGIAAWSRLRAIALWGGLALLTAIVAAAWNQTLTSTLQGRELQEREVAGERLLLSPAQAQYLPAIEHGLGARIGDDPIFIAPNRPSLYCVLGKSAPTWWIYYFWRLAPEEQQETIARLSERGVDWALIVDAPVEEREDLLFRSMNELVWAHFQRDWERVPTPELPADHLLFRRR
jgi:hypothetical protein